MDATTRSTSSRSQEASGFHTDRITPGGGHQPQVWRPPSQHSNTTGPGRHSGCRGGGQVAGRFQTGGRLRASMHAPASAPTCSNAGPRAQHPRRVEHLHPPNHKLGRTRQILVAQPVQGQAADDGLHQRLAAEGAHLPHHPVQLQAQAEGRRLVLALARNRLRARGVSGVSRGQARGSARPRARERVYAASSSGGQPAPPSHGGRGARR
jgi:hypothetical protein